MNNFLKGPLNIKKTLILGFIVGFVIGYLGYRIMGQINDGTGKIAEILSQHPFIILALMIFWLVVMTIFVIHTIAGWVRGFLKVRRVFKRLKRVNQIKKYGYVVGQN